MSCLPNNEKAQDDNMLGARALIYVYFIMNICENHIFKPNNFHNTKSVIRFLPIKNHKSSQTLHIGPLKYANLDGWFKILDVGSHLHVN